MFRVSLALALGACLLALPAATITAAAPPTADNDTTYVLGGPDRWDGRFEDQAGDPDWHGWTHADLHDPEPGSFWHVSDLLPLAGQYSLWCGTWYGEDDGYGNQWHDPVVFTRPAADPTEPTTVRLQATVQVDTESGYDFLELQRRRTENPLLWFTLVTLDGTQEIELDETITIEPGSYVDGAWSLRFLATSDEAVSDADGLLQSHGLARIDDVTVTVDGAVVSVEDFESGTSADWIPDESPLVGDFTALRRDLDDLDPEHDNDTWQVTFIDDGVVVPGTGGTPCVDWCYGPDGWVFNVTAGLHLMGVPSGPTFGWFANSGVWNGLMSPVMSWPELHDAGTLAFDVFAHMQYLECGLTTYGWTLRTTEAEDPAALANVPWQDTRWSYYLPDDMPAGPGYYRVTMPLDLPEAEFTRWVQVRLEVFAGGPYCWGDYVTQGTPAPYFDNVAVRAWRLVTGAPPAAPALSLTAAPNPFNPRVVLEYSQPAAGPVDLAIFDARGRLVRRLLAAERPAGTGELVWDGCDQAGSPVAAGIYLARLRTDAGREQKKLTLVR